MFKKEMSILFIVRIDDDSLISSLSFYIVLLSFFLSFYRIYLFIFSFFIFGFLFCLNLCLIQDNKGDNPKQPREMKI